MDEPMRDLMKESFVLLEREEKMPDGLHDYAFVVFPAAKAYEGFLKKLFLDLGFINKMQYEGDRFRVGRSLNPNLPKRYQWDWVYGRLEQKYGGELTMRMWEAWKKARNRIFHFFPAHHKFITLAEARKLIEKIVEVIIASVDRMNYTQ